ncbi:hypothetical protein DFH07DRAFT_272901 [Mycena maculata]|uniref:Uncharacterized protein n=1 Tax=Mycena maculata TaxID=230809 RepID=A0AAD7JRH7_9AGAR|nr:hypothetical protein DFH07DRAFT_272901 [Mycena maculata]
MAPKQLKIKTYTIPANRHFLFIHTPWPFNTISTKSERQLHCNSVVAWLCVMIQDLCGIEVHPTDMVIFWQSTHQDLIADIQILPSEDCPSPCLDPVLGAHHASTFLTEEHKNDARTSVIYYYDYLRKNAPGRTNWTEATSNYQSFNPRFPVRRPYPEPSPAELGKLPFTQKLPGRLILGHPECQDPGLPSAVPPQAGPSTGPGTAENPAHGGSTAAPAQSPPHRRSPSHSPPRLETTVESPPHQQDAPSELLFKPYERPMHFPRGHTVDPGRPHSPSPSQSKGSSPQPATKTKCDPYEEELAAHERLKDPSPPASVRVKMEVKTEPYEPFAELAQTLAKVEAFRASSSSHSEPGTSVKREFEPVKLEPTVPHLTSDSQGEDGPGIKQENENIKREPEYRPSAEQVDNFNQVQRLKAGGLKRKDDVSIKTEEPRNALCSIKPEPTDAPIPDARPLNRSFNPSYEPDDVEVKREERSESDFNTRQPGFNPRSPTTYPAVDPRAKREEYAPSPWADVPQRGPSRTYSPGVKLEYGSSGLGYANRDSRPPVKQESGYNSHARRGNWHPPPPSEYPDRYHSERDPRRDHGQRESTCK